MAPRFLIDENLSPMLASHLSGTHGFDAVHVNDAGLGGASDSEVLANATAEDRVIVTSNADDFRKHARRGDHHTGLAVLLEAVGRQRQIELGIALENTVEAVTVTGETAQGFVRN